ncbi:MAG: hypothetical protein NDI88_16160 [Lysobacter sp.]|nr:hypothetical protein [Lysobacter sp.]
MTFAHLLNRFRDAVASDGKPVTQPAKKPPERPKATRGVARPAPHAWLQTTHRPKAEPDLQMRRRIRDRYLAVRFPGAPHTDEELRDSASVIKSARLYFEDGDIDRACELLECAADASDKDETPWLAHLEILYLQRDAPAFTPLAKRFHEHFPNSGRWAEILRLGLRLDPEDPLFRLARPHESAIDEHYGAWPQVQNWIQAPFDLTGDVLAAEFHAKMRGGGDVSPPIIAKASDK